jgi:hypothetical protein
MIVAKFNCESIRKSNPGGGNPQEEVVLTAVTGKENEDWSTYTPYGKLEMQISNPKAQGKFEPGKDYLLRFEPAPAGS